MSIAACSRLTATSCRSLLERRSTVLFDADGVLWHGSEPIEGARDVVRKLAAAGKTVLLLTNNSTQSRRSYADKCTKLGFPEFTEDRIVGSSTVLAYYLKEQRICGPGQKVYVLGSIGVTDELTAHGIDYLPIGADPLPVDSQSRILNSISETELDANVSAVVAAYDAHFSMVKLRKACAYLWNPHCQLVATNTDPVVKGANGRMFPGTGTIVKAVETGSRRTATVVGKPYAPTWSYIRSRFGVTADDCLMVGDSLLTDIAFARQNSLASLLVLCGVTKVADLTNVDFADRLPDLFCDSLEDVLHFLP